MTTGLEPEAGEWRDTGRIARRLTTQALRVLGGEVVHRLSGPGWPEVEVPLQERYIPRRWKRVTLQKVGLTPLGFPVVLPASAPHPAPDEETPF